MILKTQNVKSPLFRTFNFSLWYLQVVIYGLIKLIKLRKQFYDFCKTAKLPRVTYGRFSQITSHISTFTLIYMSEQIWNCNIDDTVYIGTTEMKCEQFYFVINLNYLQNVVLSSFWISWETCQIICLNKYQLCQKKIYNLVLPGRYLK